MSVTLIESTPIGSAASGRIAALCMFEGDTTADFPGINDITGLTIVQGSKFHCITDNTMYAMDSSGAWIIQDEASRMDVYTKSEVDSIANYLDNKIYVNRGLIVDLINSGHKNLAQLMNTGGTFYGTTFTPDPSTGILTTSGTASGYKAYRFMGDPDNTGYAYGVPIPRGKYVLKGLPVGASSSTFRYIVGITTAPNATRTSTSYYDNDTIIDIDTDTAVIDIAAYVSQGNVFTNPVQWAPYLAPVQLNTITSTFVPYCPTLQELYNLVRSYHS